MKIKDKDYPLQFGMGCIEMFCDTLDCGIEDLEKAINPGRDQIKYFTTLVHCALKNGSDVESIYDDFEVSYREVQKAIDDMNPEDLKAIGDAFMASRYFGKTMAEHLLGELENMPESEGEVKKK